MEWLTVGRLEDLPQGGTKVEVDSHTLALFRIEEQVYVIGDQCTHAEASLSEGEVFDGAVECPLHGAEFDLHTGQPRSLPATQPVPTFPVRVVQGVVLVGMGEQ